MNRERAEDELCNWGRWLYSDMGSPVTRSGHWPIPTSEGYRTPPYIEGETPEARIPVDEPLGELTNQVVVQIGLEHFESYQVLVYWYRRLVNTSVWPRTLRRRMAKFMHTSPVGAERMLQEAVCRYQQKRLTIRRIA